MRLTGFASGMDINQMVQDLMKAERQPLQKMEQDQQELVLKMGEYREVNRAFLEFSNNTFDSVLRRANMAVKEVSSSNEAFVNGTASSGAATGMFTISDVERLATSAYNASSDSIVTNASGFDPDGSLLEQESFFSDGIERNGEGEIVFSITTYDENGESNKVDFDFDEDASLNDVVDEINSSDLNVQAFFDVQSGRMSISRTETGVNNATDGGNEIEFTGSFLTDNLLLSEENEVAAQNALFSINGLEEVERRSNTFDINGVNITLNSTFTDPVRLDVSTNTDDIFDTVMGFVGEYNELIEMVNGKVTEEYHRDYGPLTDEQRREMSESEIELWEERAHSGLLRNDRMLTGALNQMRMDMYAPIEMESANLAFSHISELGITTSSNYQDRGKLEVNEEQLRSAIEEDPEAVFQLFAADGDEYEERGIARRIRDTLGGQMQVISARAGGSESASNQSFTLGREIDQATNRISNFERRMKQVEERYWAQFNAMEQAMARANAQAESLMSQLGGLGQPM
ncbi:flagellar hook-associated protein FliD [Halalkalibacter wakoensis JCM 9140]|uniref:Flagellar hook-associated protein 2 n=1 Tax=Halalkalibacter wakoensis JCM 9140 TaxID=1236970 RepID=W4Q5B1_9BACI|nr:flagellar hook-associated protein 2 [Halalkalibacter wakoensis]GAE26534.1 flagellar hook-associated protein FliD [Halalkalibacter wakoensis JCM 9140]